MTWTLDRIDRLEADGSRKLALFFNGTRMLELTAKDLQEMADAVEWLKTEPIVTAPRSFLNQPFTDSEFLGCCAICDQWGRRWHFLIDPETDACWYCIQATRKVGVWTKGDRKSRERDRRGDHRRADK